MWIDERLDKDQQEHGYYFAASDGQIVPLEDGMILKHARKQAKFHL